MNKPYCHIQSGIIFTWLWWLFNIVGINSKENDNEILNDVLTAKHQQLETVQNWAGLNNGSHVDAAFWSNFPGLRRLVLYGSWCWVAKL